MASAPCIPFEIGTTYMDKLERGYFGLMVEIVVHYSHASSNTKKIFTYYFNPIFMNKHKNAHCCINVV